MSFSFFKYASDRGLGRPNIVGWKDSLYSSLFTSIAPTKITESTPYEGLDWGAVFGFGFAPDGSLLAAACENKCVLLYDPNNGHLIRRRFKTHTDCVNCVRFLDNRTFATCSDDTTVRLWDMRFLNQEIRVLKGHTNWVKNIEYSSSEGKLITSGFDGNIFAWDINNYSEVEKSEPLFYINGMMRTKITPDEKKMIISTLGGYFVIIHDLDLDHLKEDLKGFKPHFYRLMQLTNTPLHPALQYNYMFTRKRNRVEFMCDFPDADNAESISTIQVHPEGWCIASRNTTSDEESEWTCIHDIQPFLNENKDDQVSEGASLTDSSGNTERSSHQLRGRRPQRISRTHTSGRNRISIHINRIPSGHFVDYPTVFWGLHSIHSHFSGTNGSDDNDGDDDNDNDNSDSEDDAENQSSDDDDSYNTADEAGQSAQTRNLSTSADTSSEELSPSSFPSTDSSPQRHSDTVVDSINSVTRHSPILSGNSTSANSTSHTSDRSASHATEDTDTRTPRSHSLGFAHSGAGDSQHDDMAPSGVIFYEAMTISRGGRVRRRMAIRQTGQDSHQPLSYRSGNMRIRNVKPRLLFYSEEPNVGRGYIKEQSFSPDGRIIASPFGNCVRLLAFNDQCSELCDCVPMKPRPLKSVAMTMTQKSGILASTFSPVHYMFVAGAKDGSISFCSPRL